MIAEDVAKLHWRPAAVPTAIGVMATRGSALAAGGRRPTTSQHALLQEAEGGTLAESRRKLAAEGLDLALGRPRELLSAPTGAFPYNP